MILGRSYNGRKLPFDGEMHQRNDIENHKEDVRIHEAQSFDQCQREM
jgi:hypothetical protein